jgi:dihydrofolate reductase
MSLDGFIADENGNFDWAEPDEEVHRFVNDLERRVGTMLYGRRMYETMVWWETQGDDTDVGRDYATTWRASDKVVYSRTLERPSSARTQIERNFEVDAVRAMKDSASKDLTIGGPELAAQAIDAGLVDELQMFVVPVLVGAGKEALPVRTFSPLSLAEERRFSNGTVYLRYRVDR